MQSSQTPNFWIQLLPTRTSVLLIALRVVTNQTIRLHILLLHLTRDKRRVLNPTARFTFLKHGSLSTPRLTVHIRTSLVRQGLQGRARRQGTGYSWIHSTSATTSCTSCTSIAAEDHALSITHIRCRLHPCGSATKFLCPSLSRYLFLDFRFLYFHCVLPASFVFPVGSILEHHHRLHHCL